MSSGGPACVLVEPCGAEAAEEVHLLTRAAFAAHAGIQPPSGALIETLDDVRADLAER